MVESGQAEVTWPTSLVQSKNGVWCKSRVYCCHISQRLVKTTQRILGQQIREEKNNMSSYYVDSLLCKPAAGCCLLASAARASCRTGASGEEQGSSRTAAAFAFAPCLSGGYVGNGSQSRPVFTSGYRGEDARTQLCSALEQGSCCHPGPGPLTSPPDKQHRLYPWMRASGMSANNKVIFFSYFI